MIGMSTVCGRLGELTVARDAGLVVLHGGVSVIKAGGLVRVMTMSINNNQLTGLV